MYAICFWSIFSGNPSELRCTLPIFETSAEPDSLLELDFRKLHSQDHTFYIQKFHGTSGWRRREGSSFGTSAEPFNHAPHFRKDEAVGVAGELPRSFETIPRQNQIKWQFFFAIFPVFCSSLPLIRYLIEQSRMWKNFYFPSNPRFNCCEEDVDNAGFLIRLVSCKPTRDIAPTTVEIQ